MHRRFATDAAVFCSLVVLGILGRLLPHPPNFTPLAALGLFAGFYMKRWSTALCVPLPAMIVGDLVSGTYDPRLMGVVYLALLLPLACRPLLRSRLSPARVILCSILSSFAFYVITNFAVWALGTWYARDLAGLVSCFVAGLSFFRNTACGDLMFSSGLFAIYAALTRRHQITAWFMRLLQREAVETACRLKLVPRPGLSAQITR